MEERTLHRSCKNRMLFGVCGGLAEYFDVDSTLVRLIFVLITFAGGSGIIAYAILAIVMPSEDIATQRPRDAIRNNIADLTSSARDLGGQIRSTFGPSAGAATESTVEGQVVEGEVVQPVRQPRRDRNATAGVVLVIVGVLFLLSNVFPSWINWGRLWPLILIFIGLAIIWRRGRR